MKRNHARGAWTLAWSGHGLGGVDRGATALDEQHGREIGQRVERDLLAHQLRQPRRTAKRAADEDVRGFDDLIADTHVGSFDADRANVVLAASVHAAGDVDTRAFWHVDTALF